MAKKRRITAEDLYQFELMSGVRISPDGQWVIFSSQRVDPKTEKKYSNLFLVSTQGGDTKQFTFGDQIDAEPRWSPDGERILFLSNRADTEQPPQIYLLHFHGGEARKLTDIKGAISSVAWSSDGKHILCCVVKTDTEVLEREKDEQKKKLGIVAREYDRLFYKLDGFGYLPHERKHIWMIDVESGEGKQLTDHAVYDENDPALSPDGTTLTFMSNRSDDPDNDLYQVDLYTMSVTGGEMQKISTPKGEKSSPVFSPDGKWIAYFGAENEGKMYKSTSLWLVPADGSAQAVNLTEEFGFEVGGGVINDMGHAETMPPTWSLDGSSLYFQVGHHGSTLLKKMDINSRKVETVIDEGAEIGSFTFEVKQEKMAYFKGTLMDTGQIFIRDLATGKDTQLTRHNRALLDEINLGEIEEIWYKGAIGNDLQGWILKPPDFDPTRKYPAILEIHGGPLAQYGNFFMHEFYFLAANDYVVFFTNPRGGSGYGEEHAKAITTNWGGADYDDLMAWVDFISTKDYIDRERMGVTGGSYGGYMTNWIIGHTDRFRAAVTQRSVSNLVSMWGSSDLNWVFQQEFGNQAPYESIERLWSCSPMKYIGNAKTPTLVIHSEMDLRCPIEQGEQVFVALQRMRIDSKMVRFPDEPHGLSRTGRTDRRISRLNHILNWFNKYLKE
jgi:dipeptidyl aminopeptidase/acylaminoacyl peptidase